MSRSVHECLAIYNLYLSLYLSPDTYRPTPPHPSPRVLGLNSSPLFSFVMGWVLILGLGLGGLGGGVGVGLWRKSGEGDKGWENRAERNKIFLLGNLR